MSSSTFLWWRGYYQFYDTSHHPSINPGQIETLPLNNPRPDQPIISQAISYWTISMHKPVQSRPYSRPSSELIYSCSNVQWSAWISAAHLRSGIVTLDIHGLCASAKQPGEVVAPRRGVGQSAAEPKASVEWQKMLLFFCRVPGKLSPPFCIITRQLTWQTREQQLSL
jgi:hypothetical protein